MRDILRRIRTALEAACEEADLWAILILKLTLSAASLLLALSLVIHVLHELLGRG